MRKNIFAMLLLSGTTLLSVPAFATDFGVAAATSAVSFRSDALLETIVGTSTALSGTVSTDLANPSSTTATVSFPVTSLVTGVDMRDEHLHGADWLNAAEFPEVTFALSGAEFAAGTALTHGVAVQGTVSGTLTIRGVAQPISAPATVTYYEVANVQNTYGIDANVLRVESTFDIALSSFGIAIPEVLQTKVADTQSITVRLTALQQ